MQKIFGKIMFLAVALAGFSALAGVLFGKQTATTKMNAEEQQMLGDFEKRLDGLEREFDQLKLMLDNSDRKFDKLKRRLDGLGNRFDDLKR